MGTGASDNSLRGPRDRTSCRSHGCGGPARRVPQRIELERLEVRALLATIPAAVPLNPNTGQPLPATNLSNMMGNVGGVNASMNSSAVVGRPARSVEAGGGLGGQRPDDGGDHGQRGPGGRLEAAYSVNGGQTWLPLFGEPTNTAACRSSPSCSTRRRPARRSPTPIVTNPSVGFDDSGNFYILTEYSSGRHGGGPASSGALVLQKYDFAGSTPSPVAFTGNQQTRHLYASGFFGFGADGRPEGHLPVVQLGQQRLGARPHDDGGRQPGDPPDRASRRRPDPYLGQRLRLVDDRRHPGLSEPAAGISTPTGSRWWSPRTGGTTSAR